MCYYVLFAWYWGQLQPNICKLSYVDKTKLGAATLCKIPLPQGGTTLGIPLPLSQFSHIA